MNKILLSILVLACAIVNAAPDSGRSQALVYGPHAIHSELDHRVTARDGTVLATDLYFPAGVQRKNLPVVLIRTAYNKRLFDPAMADTHNMVAMAKFFATHGYVVAVQDLRGKFASGGDFVIAGNDAEDGYDTVQWLAHQPWSNGRVGTFGCSYLGDVQIFLAGMQPSGLKAMIPQASGGAMGSAGQMYRYLGTRVGGVVEWAASIGWIPQYARKAREPMPENLSDEQFKEWAKTASQWSAPPDFDVREAWNHLPTGTLLESLGIPDTDFKDIVSRPPSHSWWRQFPYMTEAYRSDVPALFVNSWYDYGVDASLFQFNFLRQKSVSKQARDNQFIIIGPETHCGLYENPGERTLVGERDVGDARFGYYDTFLRWFDFWLKQRSDALADMPKVQYFLMGKGQWRAAQEWPVAGTRYHTYFLDSDGRANSLRGNGRLSRTLSRRSASSDRFVYDPQHPVPTLGGSLCCTGEHLKAGAFDQRSVEARDDVLVYTSEPFDSGVEVTGPIEAVLYVSSSAPDTDFMVKLVDVYPDGRAFNLTEGVLRARYREGQDKQVFMKPEKTYELRIPMGATSNYFAPGHRLRIEITSSNFPRFDRNLNTGGENYNETKGVAATNRVWHTSRYRSRVIIPVVPSE